MKYIEAVNEAIKKRVQAYQDNLVIFGQNINAGSCISGLTRGVCPKKGFIVNTPNCENTLCGAGFGMMIEGVSSILFLKQMDFLLLGIDHLVNTYNIIRQSNSSASFTIVAVVMDGGFEGPQHSFNNFNDLCSLARISGFSITNSADIKEVIDSHLVSPGFRVIGVSQRLFKQDIFEVGKIYSSENSSIFKYSDGGDATIVCFNFSFPYGCELAKELKENGFAASLFSINSAFAPKWDDILDDLQKTGKLVIIDDGKSRNPVFNSLLTETLENCKVSRKIIVERVFSEKWFYPSDDKFKLDCKEICRTLASSSQLTIGQNI